MSSLTSKDGKLIVRDGKLGTEQACCCDGTGACCECEEFFLVEDQSGGPNTEEGAQAEVDAREAFIADFQALAEENGYTCIRKAVVGGDGQNSYVDCEEDPPEPEFPCIARLAGLYGRCCGTLSEETVSLTEEGPFGQTWTVQICIQDETTRTCVDGVTEAECSERCGEFHAGATCDELPCEPPLECAESNCYWVNYQTYPSQEPASGGWYLFQGDCGPGCECADPSAVCGEAPPEENYEECVSPCEGNPLP